MKFVRGLPSSFFVVVMCCIPQLVVADVVGYCSEGSVVDCEGVCNGEKEFDCAGACDGTNTLDRNDMCCETATQDCHNVCSGPAQLDGAGVCCVSGNLDCEQTCDGSKQNDCNSVCGGPAVMLGDQCCNSGQVDCLGVCDGAATKDTNGICCNPSEKNDAGMCEAVCPEFVVAAQRDQSNSGIHVYGDYQKFPKCATEHQSPEAAQLIGLVSNLFAPGAVSYSDQQVADASALIDSLGLNSTTKNRLLTRMNEDTLFSSIYDSETFVDMRNDPVFWNLWHQASVLSRVQACELNEKCADELVFGDQISDSSSTRVYVFNPDCTFKEKVSDNDHLKSCRLAKVKYDSPISLLVDGEEYLDGPISMVKFALDLDSDAAWFEWKASDSAPLLVYDPQHTGVITSATQLFGHWTFGGKPYAALGSFDYGVTTAQWADGYEALATLDADGNGWVDKSELEPLGLWYDTNGNGISEKGEVKKLADEGFLRLGYKVTEVVPGSQSRYADRGFERQLENGEVQRGKSVDWMGASATSKYELSQMIGAKGATLEIDAIVQYLASSPTKPLELAEGPDSFTGLYEWKGIEDDKDQQDGYIGALYLMEAKDLSIVGYAITSSPEIVGREPVSFAVTMKKLKGKVTGIKNGKRTATWSLEDDYQGTESTVSLTGTGGLMGSSATELGFGGRDRGNFKYSWEAKRLK